MLKKLKKHGFKIEKGARKGITRVVAVYGVGEIGKENQSDGGGITWVIVITKVIPFAG